MSIDFKTLIPNLDAILDRGLSSGLGERGKQVCVEAALCEALGLPHGDDPGCVATAVREYKIRLNDAGWSSPAARASGMRNLAIAQIGSLGTVDDVEFASRLAEKTIRVLIPALFRDLLSDFQSCMEAAARCESEGTAKAANTACALAQREAEAAARALEAPEEGVRWKAILEAAKAAGFACRAAEAKADVPQDDVDDVTEGAVRALALAAAVAKNAAAAEWQAMASAEAKWAEAETKAEAEAGWAAEKAAGAAAVASNDDDKYLILSAKLALDVLRELGSPGCGWVR